ncbi:hypothetical protein CYV19_01205 [Natronobacterium gregoryi SP2]|uniref:Uncharacterized protein n=1 Tax=Natronobacterium gregoryi (strain ATCC 43098 / DSM 3393 / CCM 3738 / CIP 104747 / IAM 13177 / JCM 8860 / NBRC 102187 / NCIMB 2189 / SP2) TaxID=797304 RepID=L9XP96_NATGS|nr:hypothetical protein C490_15279 [Natronobacterium gregoryi SP2]PLK22038.1 hypothetical protein CYV19_01205 [Natronobacterium gregoryi SP2]
MIGRDTWYRRRHRAGDVRAIGATTPDFVEKTTADLNAEISNGRIAACLPTRTVGRRFPPTATNYVTKTGAPVSSRRTVDEASGSIYWRSRPSASGSYGNRRFP